jgi:preprotein translocase subunit SecG
MREGEMQTVVIVIHLMIVLAMIGVVLLQKSEGGGLGMGSSGAGFLTSRGTANILTRTTAILALGFFLTSLLLSILAGADRKPRSIIPANGGAPATAPAPGAPPPLEPLSNTPLGGGGPIGAGGGAPTAPAAPAAPAAPSEPQVPRSQ